MIGSACTTEDWSPIGSAASHSQLAGVVAGLVFAGIVVILERQAPAQRRPAEALTLFVAGFFTFALDAFFFGVVAGERTCDRAWTETMVAAGLLGFGALSLFVGLSWLLYSLDRTSSTPFRATRVIVYVRPADSCRDRPLDAPHATGRLRHRDAGLSHAAHRRGRRAPARPAVAGAPPARRRRGGADTTAGPIGRRTAAGGEAGRRYRIGGARLRRGHRGPAPAPPRSMKGPGLASTRH
ncbi:hypothetical protein M1L60_36830 [Actinoplanes sp. TRM 88003]|uniref:Uncharacterized protein n=1 Tax=Paractinoplanes aksuensis TaxID=2939490 RepID=A0ABT1DZF1_9ACTN|nr:hypothetical protein [Actinoplanes aksuensis]MCO8276157.1 hypothetical protein [Actinoplanes aksuensis]